MTGSARHRPHSRWRRRVAAVLAALLVSAPALSCCCIPTSPAGHAHLEAPVEAHGVHGVGGAETAPVPQPAQRVAAFPTDHAPAQEQEQEHPPCHDRSLDGGLVVEGSAGAMQSPPDGAMHASVAACTDDAPAREAVQGFELPVTLIDLQRTWHVSAHVDLRVRAAVLRSRIPAPHQTPVTLKQVMRA
jgi:hypothetical protein